MAVGDNHLNQVHCTRRRVATGRHVDGVAEFRAA